ncbi:exonuclease domain-containing protein, partial [Apilactobacillus kunkeei]|uniref:exonuclease domain-containing protein n=1 Tax=Apilactobacillus kunkeei TaxID=148814 RepID=UPI000559636F
MTEQTEVTKEFIIHNLDFEPKLLGAQNKMEEIQNPIIDTLPLARFLYPNYKSYRLNTLAKKFDVALEHHHRAVYDAETTGHLNYLFIKDAEERYNI